MVTLPLLRSPLLDSVVGVRHAFTTREGGVSSGHLATLNLGRRPSEAPEALRENWSRVATALDPMLTASNVAVLSQVHGARVVRIEVAPGPLEAAAEADGAVTTTPGVILGVRTADCVPVLIAAPGGVAVAHAGWRGTAAGVVPATVEVLAEVTGDEPALMVAVIGPHISGEVYEVGDEVVAAIEASGAQTSRFVVARTPKPRVDLGAAVAEQLARVGVGRIDRVLACTVGDARFFSHRRDGEHTGRMAGVIVRLDQGAP